MDTVGNGKKYLANHNWILVDLDLPIQHDGQSKVGLEIYIAYLWYLEGRSRLEFWK